MKPGERMIADYKEHCSSGSPGWGTYGEKAVRDTVRIKAEQEAKPAHPFPELCSSCTGDDCCKLWRIVNCGRVWKEIDFPQVIRKDAYHN
jgi:hypothetical protein